MDRSYRSADQVHVYSSVESCSKGEDPVSIVHLVPYSLHGLDNYQYQGTMFKGYVDALTLKEIRIFLSEPLQSN